MIGIIDYGLGNVQSFINSYRKLGISAKPIKNKNDFENVDRMILPGVGSFDAAIQMLFASELIQKIEDLVLNESMPILGVCVGMQIMARKSEEGEKKGLNWIDADVKRIKKLDNLPLPHMGWNEIKLSNQDSTLLKSLNNSKFYFLHSYFLAMDNKDEQIALTNYSTVLTAAIQKNNIYGCQFHPEKSHSAGLKVLGNFANL